MATTGPKIAVVDSELDGATYGDAMRQLMRMLQALVQANVINITTTVPPATPNNGDTYIVAAGASGAWAGQVHSIAYWTTADPNVPTGKWDFYAPQTGWLIFNQGDSTFYRFNGATWVAAFSAGGVTGTGTAGTLPIWTASSTLGNSALTENDSSHTLTYAGNVFQLTGATGTAIFLGGNVGMNSRFAADDDDGTVGRGGTATLLAGAGTAAGVPGGDAKVIAGNGGSTAAGGNVYLQAGQSANPATGPFGVITCVEGVFYFTALTFSNLPAPPPNNPETINNHGATVFCTDAKGPQDGATWGSAAAGSGTGALLRYTGAGWIVVG